MTAVTMGGGAVVQWEYIYSHVQFWGGWVIIVVCAKVSKGHQGSSQRWGPGCVNAADKARQKW